MDCKYECNKADAMKMIIAKNPNDTWALYNLGVCYSHGDGTAVNDELAFKYYLKAADLGHSKAQVNIGICYSEGRGVQKNDKKAVEYFKLAANTGDIDAYYSLGVCYEEGRGVQKSEEKAVEYFKLAADEGDIEACYMMGLCYEEGKGIQKNEKIAIKYYSRVADNGYPEVQYKVGLFYEIAGKTELNYVKAFEYYKKAAHNGHVMAQYKVGLCYENGTGTLSNDRKAFEYYKLAANKGYVIAQYKLGYCYEKGIGVIKDKGLAVKYYKLAADAGFADAQYKLGICYKLGRLGLSIDYNTAIELFQKAALQGHILAQNKISECGLKRRTPIDLNKQQHCKKKYAYKKKETLENSPSIAIYNIDTTKEILLPHDSLIEPSDMSQILSATGSLIKLVFNLEPQIADFIQEKAGSLDKRYEIIIKIENYSDISKSTATFEKKQGNLTLICKTSPKTALFFMREIKNTKVATKLEYEEDSRRFVLSTFYILSDSKNYKQDYKNDKKIITACGTTPKTNYNYPPVFRPRMPRPRNYDGSEFSLDRYVE